ncbi:MAG TPA: serine/threonine-protein kinase, partial [Victivallales bacterium]|nr:serine/threonine-protein kinase [Victivallales bacterium]
AVETDENKPDADSGEDDSEKTPQISQEYLRESATDDMGNSRGPFMFVFDDGKVLEAQRIVNCLPEHVVVEIIEKGTPRTIRFPYSKISSFVLKEEWDPENIPLMTKAPSRESKGTEKKEEKKNELGINVNLVSKLKKLSREEDSSKSSPEETAKLTMEMMSQSTHIGSYVLLKPATEIGGCRIISEIGKGGMGMVYLARHTRLDINVAVKVLSAKCEDEHDINISQRFLQEAKIAAKIRHPHLVSVMDAGKDEPNELFYIVMEYVDGGTVGDMIRKNGKISQSDALNIILAVSEALSAGQKFNIVHRDIKPDNIMLSSEGDIKLSDLGLAKINEPRMELHLTGVNMVLGSIPYMSPEQAKDFTKADFRSDVYSLGTTLYHMLTGNFPYTGDNPLALVMKAMNDPTPNPKDHCPEIDEEVAAACMKMMGKKPEDRFQTPEELIEEINRLSKKIST